MIDHDFQTMDRQQADLPYILKKSQIKHRSELDQLFNEVIHVDLIDANYPTPNVSAPAILSITDHTRTFTQLTVLPDDKINSVATTIWHHWCQPYGNPVTIMSNKGKVWTSKLESRINKLNQIGPKITCRSEKELFSPEMGTTPTGYFGGEFRTSLEFSVPFPNPEQYRFKIRQPQPSGLRLRRH